MIFPVNTLTQAARRGVRLHEAPSVILLKQVSLEVKSSGLGLLDENGFFWKTSEALWTFNFFITCMFFSTIKRNTGF